MKVVLVETRKGLQFFDLQKAHHSVVHRNQAVLTELFEDAVHVHRGQAQRVAQFGLGQR